ncbi:MULTISPECIES: heme exporter protein CcmD [unclassified Moraxella]|uniref:heme exporter protein CcmD n=1 Tax=unclassified Moraxella TaxID=2685852 RepID=UPI002B413F5D|nr:MULTISPECIES: heme exporter protein CcmD [unclassified Moraxella]
MTPYFPTFGEFIDMQGHGVFVWVCYAITFVALFALIMYAASERKSTIARLQHQKSNKQKSDRLTNKQRKELAK